MFIVRGLFLFGYALTNVTELHSYATESTDDNVYLFVSSFVSEYNIIK